MGTGIKINCRKVYETGLTYDKAAELVKDKQTELKEISNSIDSAWKGGDSNNFLVSFDEHIKSLDEVINFLEEEAAILKGNALEHSNVDDNFSIKMKRSDLDE